jgi:hypothetical protein
LGISALAVIVTLSTASLAVRTLEFVLVGNRGVVSRSLPLRSHSEGSAQ